MTAQPTTETPTPEPGVPSWDEIVEKHSDRGYRLAYRLTGNRPDAEDRFTMERRNEEESPSGNKIISVKTRKGTRADIANHGYVLVISLWAIVVLGFIALSITRNTTLAIRTEISFTERVKNIYAARGACIYATQKLLQSKNQEKDEKASKNAELKKEKGADTWRKKRDSRPWMPSNSPYSVRIGDRDCAVLISDESGKINVNKITDDMRSSFVRVVGGSIHSPAGQGINWPPNAFSSVQPREERYSRITN